jgi:hypothetical protein
MHGIVGDRSTQMHAMGVLVIFSDVQAGDGARRTKFQADGYKIVYHFGSYNLLFSDEEKVRVFVSMSDLLTTIENCFRVKEPS